MPVTGLLDGIKPAMLQSIGAAAEFVDAVDLRLQSLGYTLQESDPWLVAFEIQAVMTRIKNECNAAAMPKGLMPAAVNMVCGEFLLGKKESGQLDGFQVDLNSPALKQTQSGDTNVVFAAEGVASAEQRLNAVIQFLINSGKGQFITYRRLKWT